jgi:hypothetical protein
MKTPNRDRHSADSGSGRNLNQLEPLFDPSHAAIKIVQTHGHTGKPATSRSNIVSPHSRIPALVDR